MAPKAKLDANGKRFAFYILSVAAIHALLQGYDQAMINGLNILPTYTAYFNLTTTSTLYALNTSILYLGTLAVTPFSPYIANHWGRKWRLRTSAILGIGSAILQSATVHEVMFMIGRFVIGAAINTGYVVAPAYISETIHPSWRVLVVGFGASSWYLGSIVASFVTYGSQYISDGVSNCTWRLPSFLQLFPSILCLTVLHLVPESPQWLVYQDRSTEAFEILVKYHGNGDPHSSVVALEYSEIIDAIRKESETQTTGWREFLRTAQNRRRGVICGALGIMMYWGGNSIISYYIGDVLDAAGITRVSTQLTVNIGFAIWGYLVATFGTLYSDRMGRRPTFLISNIGMVIFLIIQGILTKIYSDNFTPATSGAVVLTIFLFNAAYSIAMTPLAYLHPAEVCNYSLRANGLGLNNFVTHLAGFATSYWTPYAIRKAWIYYIVYAAWEILQAIFVWFYFPKTKGLALEEVEVLFGE